ncbi:MAG: exodeoxyribonuclease VII small subunit [Clostridia bacterium]|nr:exodeoxyribonuclease VII small subunit [Oscillospiraceae bacterium]MBR4892824.1 exodeoxyribonuclease VII small subunit [Clostridia bacterium]
MATFEENLKQLENIVSKLEKGDAPLEESIKMFEEGVLIANTLSKTLDEAEGKIKIVTGSSLKDFNIE